MLRKPEISAGLMGQLARKQTLPYLMLPYPKAGLNLFELKGVVPAVDLSPHRLCLSCVRGCPATNPTWDDMTKITDIYTQTRYIAAKLRRIKQIQSTLAM